MMGFLGKSPSNKSGSSSSGRRLLAVELVAARGIIACVKNGTSDPYVSISLTDLADREIKDEKFKSKQKTGTLQPVWDEKFTFGHKYNLDTVDNLPSIVFQLYHKTAYAVSETPMGQVKISLDTIDPTGKTAEAWYPLETLGRMTTVSGELKIKLSFSGPPTVTDLEHEGLLGDSGGGDEENQNEEDEEPANELHITIISGKNLPIMDKNMFSSGGSSDPQVRIDIEGLKRQTTKYIRKDLNPTWNEKFIFSPVINPNTPVKITVEDHNDLKPTCDFMGRISLNLADFDDKKPKRKTYKLKNKLMETDGVDRGEIDILVQWKFNVKVKEEILKNKEKYDASALGKLNALGNKIGKAVGAVSDTESEVDDGADANAKAEAERPLTEEEKEKQKKEEEEKIKDLANIDIKDGDYQIQVHIIECRDLKAENLDGTSDPVVYIDVFGQKQNTIVIKSCTSCVFDELFIFNLKNLDKEAFEEGIIRIACYDSNAVPLAKNKMIGAYVCDATMVYTMNKDHELYRKWVPLMDDEDPEDVGVQGYMKISISIVGPGEKIKVHDEDAERAKELAEENAAGGDVGSLVLSTPTIRKDWNFIVCSIYKCEGLPVMDGKVGMSIATVKKAGTDAFCKLSFGGGKPIKTKTITVSGESRSMINPDFNYELWYPVSIPSMTQIIKFNVWDEDPTESELIGNVIEKFNKVSKGAPELRWYNMYGCPEFKQEKLLANIKKGAEIVSKRAKQAIGADIDWGEYYNNVPDKASTFKGRALMKFRVESKRPEKYDKPEVKPFKRRLKPITRKQEPQTREYTLQALFVCGTELPSFGTIANQKLLVKVTCGIHELATKPAKFENGQCRWNELLFSEKLTLPVDTNQIPDIFIYLVREDLKPVCFYRLKPTVVNPDDPKVPLLIGFDQPAQWYLLQEDKSIDALSADVFPGNVLIKLGFGLSSESEKSKPHWKNCLEMSKKGSPYQVRVHVYQAKEVPAADSNGLADPYVKVTFMGQMQKTDVVKKNLYPGYYKTFIFDDVMIPEYENFQYASQVSFRLFDSDDLDSHDYLGCCFLGMQDAFITPDPDAELPIPKWLDFFREVPKDGEGHLLASVQLIPTMGKTIPKTAKSIIPPTRKAYIEMILIGARDMAPFNFQAMQAPFLEIELNSFGTSYLSQTGTSKKPNPSNPNFLEKIVMPVSLPEKSIFATPLQIRAKDTRLGGYMKPVVGVGQIDLTTKIPWCLDTYKAPQTDMFMQPEEDRGGMGGNAAMSGILPGMNADPTSLEMQEMKSKRNAELIEDNFIASQEPVNVDTYVKGRVAIDDTGAGVFGALNHISMDGQSKKKKTGENAFSDPDWTQDDGDQPPAWSINRKTLDEELEAEFKTTPFETYALTRGQKNGLFGSTLKVVGKLKGLVRIIENENEPPLLSKELMEQLLKPKKYKIRLYCLRGVSLASMDYDMFGKPANSDPYLKVTLGKDCFNDRENAVDDVKNVDFYKMIDFDAELPGTSQLMIEVMDKDMIGSDDLIGRTTIDLEDRWFDQRWQEWGEENVVIPGSDPKDKTKCRWQTKPVERRSLYAPKQTAPQGVLECWVDILRPEIASTFPPDDVALPPSQIFEVRVVIWKSKNVPPMDSLEGMSDLYVKCWPEGCAAQETDTHWRCKKGKASWNWRLLFDVELGHSTRAMKFPYFHLQLWDRDLLKWNDCAGEGIIDLGKYYRKAYKRNVALKLFETKKGAAAKRAAKKEKHKRDHNIPDTTEDIPPEEEKKEGEEEEVVSPLITNNNAPTATNNTALLPPRDEPDSDDDDDDYTGAIPLNSQKAKSDDPKSPTKAAEKPKPKKSKFGDKPKKLTPPPQANAGPFAWLMFWKSNKQALEENKKLLDKDGNPVDGDDEDGKEGDEPPEKSEEEKKNDDDEESKAMINTLKSMTGLWDIDPDDSTWFHLENKDKNDPTKIVPMGSICYSIQIWPKDKATVMAVGAARSEPNTNPFLPPPTGRLKFSWNPFVMGSELCGPVLCAKIFCCLICLGFIALMIFCQPFLNIIINLIFVVY